MRKTDFAVEHVLKDIKDNPGVLQTLRSSTQLAQATNAFGILFRYLSEKDLSTAGTPTYMENAVFLTAHYFAILNQAQKVPEGETSLFKALGKQADTALDRRVNNVFYAVNSFTSVVNQLNHLVSIVKPSVHDLDYKQLAYDLYQLQFGGDAASRVIIRWGQDYTLGAFANKDESEDE